MKLGAIEAHGPAGQVMKIEAQPEGELVTEIGSHFVEVADTGIQADGVPVVIASIPNTWAFLYEWQIDAPPSIKKQ